MNIQQETNKETEQCRTEELTAKQQQKLEELINGYQDIFVKDKNELG